jgi:hypothetical protein
VGVADDGRAAAPWDRYYRGACAPGTFMALLEYPATVGEEVTADCPRCGRVVMTTTEPRLPGRT